ncbi:HNH endonuclease [Methanogenium organophilum]|uniref:HNH endonuclease signature motif containing protein n=1 Tax=Methanogenium organophilum TaxID=2199 RepID=A0A9X9S3R6_METOG|nr:HNH endonuclease signature motif containing protein [Methanogenium organophilum]WAI01369.1 HNH endonuclease signature motif containing protein [Methanogenium organophilum]
MATNTKKDKAWNNAKTVRGKDPKRYRKDPYGNVICISSYGKTSPMGWDVDHIEPKSKGGSDSTRNLQALNASVNRSKKDSQKKKSRHSKCNK